MNPIDVVTSVIDVFTIVKTLDNLRLKYKNAPEELASIINETTVAKNQMVAVEAVLNGSPESLRVSQTGQMLLACFTTSVKGLRKVLEGFDDERKKLEGKVKCRFGFFEKSKFIWKEDYFKDALAEIKRHKDDVQFVMITINV
jgi:hypothetical protein